MNVKKTITLNFFVAKSSILSFSPLNFFPFGIIILRKTKVNNSVMDIKKIFSGKLTSILLGVIVCIFWGSNYPFIKMSYSAFAIDSSSIPAIMLMAGMRFLVCGIAFITILGTKEKKLKLPDKTNILPILAIGMITIVIHYTLTYAGISMCESSKSSILKQIGYLFISCFAFVFVKSDKFTFGKLIGGILGFLGIIAVNMNGLNLSFGVGELFILLASLFSATGTIVSKYVFKYHEPVFCTAYSQFIGGVILIVAGLVMGGRFGRVGIDSVAILLYICFSSVVAYSIWNTLIKYNDISKMSIIKYLEPLFGVIFSGIILGENIFRLSYLFAFLLIIAAIIAGNLKTKKSG